MKRAEAVERLTNRYNEQALKFPIMRDKITLKGYISANIRTVMRGNLLASYSSSGR